jgi:hypothetical protein
LEKLTVSIFKAEVTKLGVRGFDRVRGREAEGVGPLLCHFSPEDEDSMFLQNVGICLPNDMATKPKTTSR